VLHCELDQVGDKGRAGLTLRCFFRAFMFRRLSFSGWALVGCFVFQLAVRGASPIAIKDGRFTDFFRRTNGWEAGDVATSVALPDGRVLWLFGDSFIDQLDPATGTTPCIFDARNALLVQKPEDPSNPVTLQPTGGGSGRTFFRAPEAAPGEPWPCFWPGTGYENDGAIYISLMEEDKTPAGGMWGFKSVGQYWGILRTTNLTSVAYFKLPSFKGIQFWSGFVPDKAQGCVYAFGEKGHGITSDVFTARFPINDPTGAWVFWDGNAWTPEAAKAAPVAHGTSSSVNVCRIQGKYLLVSTEFSVACDQGRQIFVSVSDSPTGPFSAPQSIFIIDDAVEGHQPFFYAANAHPEFINEREELLITYCINGYAPCLPSCVDGRSNPDYYRPRGIRLPLRLVEGFSH
jgi:hypothetical protein